MVDGTEMSDELWDEKRDMIFMRVLSADEFLGVRRPPIGFAPCSLKISGNELFHTFDKSCSHINVSNCMTIHNLIKTIIIPFFYLSHS